jgi:hypothetical protein
MNSITAIFPFTAKLKEQKSHQSALMANAPTGKQRITFCDQSDRDEPQQTNPQSKWRKEEEKS